MKKLYQLSLVALGIGFAAAASVPAGAAPPASKARDVCIAAPTGGGGFNTFVFRSMEPLAPGHAVTLRGVYFTTGSMRLSPVHGSAAMASNGTVRLGFFVHTLAESINDFTVSGVTDETFAGTVKYDNDGDFKENGTLVMAPVDCTSLNIP